MLRSCRLILACAALVVAVPSRGAGVLVETGEIAGARFTVARPAGQWNRQILLLAHGYRPEDRPLLADLEPTRFAHRALLDEGWMIASTSFRRNGVIVADAIADLDALRDHLEQKYGTPIRVLLEGDSMGGFVAALIAERAPAEPRLYHGAIAVGAALDIKDPNSNLGLNLQPRIPLLFLSNQSEFEGPRGYAESKLPPDAEVVRPVLFRVARDGHVNVNQRERLAARRALNAWLDRGRDAVPPAPPERFFDATVPPLSQPSKVARHADGRGFDARVAEVNGIYGNVILDAQPDDFAALGIGLMARFQLSAHEKSFRVLLGRNFTNVKRGEWVAFPDAEGFMLLSRSYADAAGVARLAVGDKVTIRRYGAGEEKNEPAEK
jgi:pimeloyl-ACP methyl ester carboxylesterase